MDQVVGIHRVSWNEIIKPDSTINGEDGSVATGVIKMDGKLVVILDFEAIVSSISPETGLRVNDIEQIGERSRSEDPILIAEDSPLLSSLITDCLKKAGYEKLIVTCNGQEAWDYLCELKKNNGVEYGAKCLITDIEMPQMDGHHLIKKIRETEGLKQIPIVIFSSLINEDMKRKGDLLGADAQISKPEIGQLVGILDSLVASQIYGTNK